MFSARWSNFSLIGLVCLAGLFAFYGGQLSGYRRAEAVQRIRASEANARRNPPPVVADAPSIVAIQDEPVTMSAWEKRWTELRLQSPTPESEVMVTALVEELAGRDPQRAIALAAGEANLRLRAALLHAVMKGWGKADAVAAAAWAETQGIMDRGQAVAAILQGAVQDSDSAMQLTAALIGRDPARSLEYGNDLISALNETGRFDRAVSFALNGSAQCREDWMLTAFSRWAEFQPEAAAAAAGRLSDPALRTVAMNSVIIGWAPSNPQSLIEFSRRNFSAEQQSAALMSAIGFWAESDTAAAAGWINQHAPGAAADPGVAAIALSPGLTRNPEVAVDWAHSISNEQLRTETLTTVIERWAAVDPQRAENYVTFSPALAAEERSLISSHLKTQAAP